MSDGVNGIDKPKMGRARSEVVFRMGLILALVFIAFIAIAVKVVYLTTIAREGNMQYAYTEQYEVDKLPRRGDILAANHVPLSVSVPYYRVDLDMRPLSIPAEVYNKGVDSLALCLSRFFKDHNKEYYRKLLDNSRRNTKGTVHLRDSVSYFELNELKKFPIFRRGVPVGGYVATEVPIRIRPLGSMAARTIGMYNYKSEEATGLERYCNEWLKGEAGKAVRQKVVGRSEVEMIVEEPVNGATVVTTIDVEMQDIVSNALFSQMKNQRGEWGAAILMEVATGDIKAIANCTRYGDRYVEDENHAVMRAAELGSVMKTATYIAMFEDGEYEPNSIVSLGGKGYYEFQAKKRIRESAGHTDLDSVSIKDMYKMSSNGISMIGNNIYGKDPAKLLDRWRAMGLYNTTGIQLVGETSPIIRHPDTPGWDFNFNNLPWMIVGYSLTMTPLQMCAFYNGIANGGQRVKPRLIKEIIRDGKVIERFDVEEVGEAMYGSTTREYLDTIMRSVVSERGGTGYRIRSSNYGIAGKTGTAFWSSGKSGYSANKERCSFVGYFPADAPKYTCIVVIDDPKVNASGGAVSAPVFKEIADKVYAIMGRESNVDITDDTEITAVPVAKSGYGADLIKICKELDLEYSNGVDGDWAVVSRKVDDENCEYIDMTSATFKENLVPNVVGMGLRDALYLIESCGMRVTVSGSGRVFSQSVKGGSRILRGGTVHLNLR